jgi:flagellar basal-body rod modification protein FlgD
MASMASLLSMLTEKNRQQEAVVAKPAAGPGSGGSGGNSNNSTNSASISANDFLTLLVTEMQNQDPTQATDPNEYINQLVNVNSLEQLISINQNLQTALGLNTNTNTNTRSASTASQQARAAGTVTGTGQSAWSGAAKGPELANQTAGLPGARMRLGTGGAAPSPVEGNLSIPAARPAAQRVAQSLGAQTRTHR